MLFNSSRYGKYLKREKILMIFFQIWFSEKAVFTWKEHAQNLAIHSNGWKIYLKEASNVLIIIGDGFLQVLIPKTLHPRPSFQGPAEFSVPCIWLAALLTPLCFSVALVMFNTRHEGTLVTALYQQIFADRC